LTLGAYHNVTGFGANLRVVADLPDNLALKHDPPLVEILVNMGGVLQSGSIAYQADVVAAVGKKPL
jgi:hypothetical protein